MEEQLLKDLLATAEEYNFDWKAVMLKFPELADIDLQLLKDYAATAKEANYDYQLVNSKFPELFDVKKKSQQPSQDMESSLVDGSSDLQESNPLSRDELQSRVDESEMLNPSEPVGRDVREDDYTSPTRGGGMYPTQDQLNSSNDQMFADFEYTKQQADAEKPALEARVREELAEKQQQDLDAAALVSGTTQSEDFQADISLLNDDLLEQEVWEESAVVRLRDTYKKYGFVFQDTGVPNSVMVIAPDGVTTTIVDLEKKRGGSEAINKLKTFITRNLRPDEAKEETTDEVTNALRAKQLRNKGRTNKDGSVSSVLFTSFSEDGKHKVIPTLFPKDKDEYGSDPLYWEELGFEAARDKAEWRGEVFEFETEEEAQDFAEGSWKDISTADAEAKNFYANYGLDYSIDKKILDEYSSKKDQMLWLQNDSERDFKYDDLTDSEKKKYGKKYFINGTLRNDWGSILDNLEKEVEGLGDLVLEDKNQTAREEFDLYLNKQYEAKAGVAISENRDAKEEWDNVNTRTLNIFGINLNQLKDYIPKNEGEVIRAKNLLELGAKADFRKELAAEKYERSVLYYDMKHNKQISMEFADNLEGLWMEVQNGYQRGKAGDIILLASMFPELLGGYDLDDPDSTQKAAEKIVEFLKNRSSKESRVMSRWNQSETGQEMWDVFQDNPMEWMSTLAGQSLAQMAPYGWKIVGAALATGAGAGAATGALGANPLTVAGGAALGATWGFRTGFATTSIAMEYTNAVIEAISNKGYDINDPESVAKALQDPGVWAEGKERGLKRGIPIAVVDLITAKLAGNFFRVGSIAGKPKRVGALLAERGIVDPATEGLGEGLAQITVGDEINMKEIYAEMGGGFGNNTANMAINLARRTRAKSNIDLASKLTNIDFMAKELSSDAQITKWTNNMVRLEQITAEQGQRINENVGLRRDAKELTETDFVGELFKGSKGRKAQARTMALLNARKDLESTPNRKRVFGKKIGEINTELELILETGVVPAKDSKESVLLAGQGLLEASEQASGTDTRSGLPSYKLKKGRRIVEVSKKEFLEFIEGLDKDRLLKFNGSVSNDDEVSEILTEKITEAEGVDTAENVEVAEATPPNIIVGNSVETSTEEKETFGEGSLKENVFVNDTKSSYVIVSDKDGQVFVVDELNGNVINTYDSKAEAVQEVSRQVSLDARAEELLKPAEETKTKKRRGQETIAAPLETQDEAAETEVGVQEEAVEAEVELQEEAVTTTELQKEVAEVEELKVKKELTSEEANAQAIADFEAELEDGPSVDFRFKTKSNTKSGVVASEAAEVTDIINQIETPNAENVVEDERVAQKIDVDELNSRTDVPLNSVSLSVLDGVPTMFSITDQLTTGDVTNPVTGKVIKNLKGAIGFNGTKGNEDAAWANLTEVKAQDAIDKATRVYQENPDELNNWWTKNPEYKGLVPMNIVKMSPEALMSNEALFRVLADNISTLPKSNRRKALAVLKAELKSKIEVLEEKENPPKSLGELSRLLKAVEDSGAKSIDDVLTPEFVQPLSVSVRTHLSGLVTVGSPNTPLEKSKKSGKVGAKGKAVPRALVEGINTQAQVAKIHIGNMTDLITDPQLRDVPIGNVVSIVGVDVLNPGIVKTNHPNYKYGPRGKSIGILGSPVSVEKVYPKAWEKVIKTLVEKESKVGEEAGVPNKVHGKTVRTQQLAVGIGLPSNDYVGVMTNESPQNIDKLNTFMNIAFPSVMINTDINSFDDVLSSEGVKVYLKGDEVIYGVTVNGDIYINPDTHNSDSQLYNTAIHEMGHVWTDYLQTTEKGRAIYKKGAALVQQTEEFKKQLKLFKGDVAGATNEAMAVLIGNNGETIAAGSLSLDSQFKEWLMGMWSYIKSQFKMSEDLTDEEVRNLTLDQFLGSALADIFAGKEIKMTDSQLKSLKNPSAAFSKSLSMDSIIEKGRQQGFPDAAIKVVLKNRGFKNADIKAALVVNVINKNTQMPNVFGNVEGGAISGQRLFNETRERLNRWSTPEDLAGVKVDMLNPKAIRNSEDKTLSDIRQKALELLRANPIFRIQEVQTQLELEIAFDRILGIRQNRNVSREVGDMRRKVRDIKITTNNIKDAQRRMRAFIRKALPKSTNYKNAALNKLLSVITETNTKNFNGQIEKVLTEVDKKRLVLRNSVIDDIIKIVKAKAGSATTKSGRRRSKGLDAVGQAYFEQANRVLILAKDRNIQGLIDMQLEIDSEALSKAIADFESGKEIDVHQRKLIDKQLAIDTFGDVMNMELEGAESMLAEVKAIRAESIARLNNRRALRRDAIAEVKTEFEEQIYEAYPELYDENGKPLNANALKDEQKAVRTALKQKGIWAATEALVGLMKRNGKYKQNLIEAFLKNNLIHFGTYVNILDRGKESMFTNYFYNPLNDYSENELRGIYRVKDVFSGMTRSETNLDWKKWKYSLESNDVLFLSGIIDSKTKNKISKNNTPSFSRDQAMRIYALSLNPVQRRKLLAMGFDEEKMKSVQDFIKPSGVSIVNQTVDYFSNTYFNEVNDVFVQANDVNLGYVENYFPTKTLTDAERNANVLTDNTSFSKIFTADTAPALQGRTDMTSDIFLDDTFSGTVENHIATMEKYKAYALGVKQMNEVLKSRDIQTLLTETGLKKLFDMSLNFAINPNAGPMVSADFVSVFQRKFTGYALAFKVIQLGKQMTSFVQPYSDYGYFPNKKTPVVDAVGFLLDYAWVLGRLPYEIKESMDISATFRHRVETGLEGDTWGLESGGRTYKKIGSKSQRKFDTYSGIFTTGGDILGVIAYKAVYNRNIKNGMSKAKALRLFNNYNVTQQTRRATEKVRLQQSNNWADRSFTMFASTVLLQINQTYQSSNSIIKAVSRGEKPRITDIRKLALNYSIANMLFAAVSHVFQFTKGNDEDKDEAMEAVMDAAKGLNLVYQIPLIGAAAEWAVNKQKGNRRPSNDVVNPFLSVMTKIDRELRSYQDNPEEVWKAGLPILELAIGAQLDSPLALGKLLTGNADEDTYYELWGVSRSYRPGYGKPKKKEKALKPAKLPKGSKTGDIVKKIKSDNKKRMDKFKIR